MQVILLDKVANLGSLGSRVNIKADCARSFLVPRGKVVPTAEESIEFFGAHRAGLEVKSADVLSIAKTYTGKINTLKTVTITSKADDEGKLLDSIDTRGTANAVAATGVEIAKSEVRLPNGILHTIDEYEMNFQVHNEMFAKLTVNVVAE